MKLEIKLKNGSKQVIDNVEEYTIINDETAKISPPTEGEIFEVDLSRIKKELFRTPRKDDKQEKTRQLIIKAFSKVDATTQKFTIYVPKRIWSDGESKTMVWLLSYAKQFGGRVATWIEWALVLAQRISNGESWKDICKFTNSRFGNVKNFWLVSTGKEDYHSLRAIFWVVGGEFFPPAYISIEIDERDCSELTYTVPLIRLND